MLNGVNVSSVKHMLKIVGSGAIALGQDADRVDQSAPRAAARTASEFPKTRPKRRKRPLASIAQADAKTMACICICFFF